MHSKLRNVVWFLTQDWEEKPTNKVYIYVWFSLLCKCGSIAVFPGGVLGPEHLRLSSPRHLGWASGGLQEAYHGSLACVLGGRGRSRGRGQCLS